MVDAILGVGNMRWVGIATLALVSGILFYFFCRIYYDDYWPWPKAIGTALLKTVLVLALTVAVLYALEWTLWAILPGWAVLRFVINFITIMLAVPVIRWWSRLFDWTLNTIPRFFR